MTTSAYYSGPKILQRLHEGPLGVHIDIYAAKLLKEGHCQQSAWRSLRVVCDFSHWLARKRLDLHDLDEQTVKQYERFRLRYRCPFVSDHSALQRLLTVLRENDAIAPRPTVVLSQLDQIVEDFDRYLSLQCGLARVTITRHIPVVRRFLHERCAGGSAQVSRMTAADVVRFVERHAGDHSPRSAQSMCWSLRAFTRYLQYQGYIATDLASSVPSVKQWRLASLPTYLLPQQVQKILDSCDRSSPMGMRDYAILLLLARLGLRASEIAKLTLDDIDWQLGQLTTRGKGRRQDQLPLPAEVGAAIADYLRRGRPRSESRRVFIRVAAPHIGFASSSNVSMIAKMALVRGGIDGVAHKGAHLFRHSLATQLLRAGASLTEIGQLLRHQQHDTTRIYAKVDISTLRSIALKWPGGAS
ncbi:site-specific integrase [Collimonas antrihumi]|uniref:site-specific integrase n=1 Tax=Collimonas antrihumi TaxID=1940615 RepID=UPI001B8CDD48|nr:site-specific integrase [Collimonas antrihumi]